MRLSPASRQWSLVVLFAIAMAWLESATVYYLRVMADRVIPYQPNPLPMDPVIGRVEIVREAATLVMLALVGAIAGRTWRARLGYSAIAFGVWDIFYYLFLKAICGWPASLFDWDILFLLPLPWWGPVAAPVCIALLMIVWGTLVTRPGAGTPPLVSWTHGLCAAGIALALYVFMADAIHAAPRGADAVRTALPTVFHWPLFAVALALMSAPIPRLTSGRSAAPGR
ncbi:MAG TPA: hypothetical protein VEU08_07480 [Vicinamibacterales bacterium]|nr:hypothetical protein [Vicinamibacterales bacterium]